jgi:hypothetical protein
MTTTGPRVGAHVLIRGPLKGVVQAKTGVDRWCLLLDGGGTAYLSPDQFEVIPEPLRVGDVITADSPEPSTVVTVVNNHGDAVRYNTNGTIATTWRDQNCTGWHDFIKVHGSSGAWTVAHVGEGAQ